MRPHRLLAALLLSFSLTATAAHAQYTIAAVTFKHPGPYSTPELLAASGLKLGQPLGRTTLPEAAQRLLNTGLFSDAQMDYTGSGKTRTILIDLKPIPLEKLLPASFENFVWFTPEELTAGIHDRIPLFRGVASDAGTLPDDIQAALQQMLTAKGVTATLSHEIIEPTNLHPRLAVNFKVDSPRIVFAQANIAGIPDALKEDTLRILQRTQGGPYNEGLTGFTIEDTILIPARSAGLTSATLQDIHRTFAPTPNGLAVTYSATFIPGAVYNVSTATWAPTPIYSAADFARDSELHAGSPASDEALRHTEAAISRAYLRHGYMDVYVLPHPTTDAAAHTIAYAFEAVPGAVYQLHTVTVDGLPDQQHTLFLANWPLKPGDPYSDLAVSDYLAKFVAQPVFRQFDAGFKAVGDPTTHQVDLTLTFTPNGNKPF